MFSKAFLSICEQILVYSAFPTLSISSSIKIFQFDSLISSIATFCSSSESDDYSSSVIVN